MSTSERWNLYRRGGYRAATQTPPASADESFYLAVLAWNEQHIVHVASYAALAASLAPEQLVYAQAARYLERVQHAGTARVYASSEGFSAFIRGGGNIPLYEATSAALQRTYRQQPSLRVLDIGTGDGYALLPALTPDIQLDLDVLEPSASLYAALTAQLQARAIPYRGHTMTLQQFAAQTSEHWDMAQATYSLQSIAPAERQGVLKWLHDHTERLLIVEFDVPEFTAMCAPDRVAHFVARYTQGLAEYHEQLELVGQRFLMPVFFGSFDATAKRTNYEQPISAWANDIRRAGFAQVQHVELYRYWWASARLIDASRQAREMAQRPDELDLVHVKMACVAVEHKTSATEETQYDKAKDDCSPGDAERTMAVPVEQHF